MTDSGLQYKDLRDGSGDTAANGSHVTIDWDGYTLGYYGRPFEARNKVLCHNTCSMSSSILPADCVHNFAMLTCQHTLHACTALMCVHMRAGVTLGANAFAILL